MKSNFLAKKRDGIGGKGFCRAPARRGRGDRVRRVPS